MFASVAGDHVPVDPPHGTHGVVRWRDVPIAMYYACYEVEMAITLTLEESGLFRFRLKTVDDRPGRIVVRQVEELPGYVAEAVVGRFENDVDLAQRLVDAFEEQISLFSAKRALDYVPN